LLTLMMASMRRCHHPRHRRAAPLTSWSLARGCLPQPPLHRLLLGRDPRRLRKPLMRVGKRSLPLLKPRRPAGRHFGSSSASFVCSFHSSRRLARRCLTTNASTLAPIGHDGSRPSTPSSCGCDGLDAGARRQSPQSPLRRDNWCANALHCPTGSRRLATDLWLRSLRANYWNRARPSTTRPPHRRDRA